jgi:glycosyltransferase involved in cell wall biosynthesis
VTDAKPGVNLVGFVGGEQGHGPSVRLGLGEVVRRIERGLEHAGISFVTIPYRSSEASETSGFDAAKAVYDTNLICLNADYLGHFLADGGPGFFTDRMSIGFWFWETSQLRLDPGTPLACLDEVWVASSYTRDAVAPEIDIPVFVAPLPMEAPSAVRRTRAELGLPDGFLFLFVFNFVSSVRKNPLAVVDAFTRAFAPGEGPVLVLKSVNGRDRKPRLLAELEDAVRGRPDVLVVDRYVSEEETGAFIANCDCYVSLHRSEGLGLTIVEAIARGKPVIATGYSGNLDFMNERSSYLVPHELVSVPRTWWAYAPGATWAEPDVDVAARLMRRVYEHPDESKILGQRARDELFERFSILRTADFIGARLDDLRRRIAIRSPARPFILDASHRLSTDPGLSLAEKKGRFPTSLVRRLLYRALWPYLEDQRRVERSMLDALTALERSMAETERRVSDLEAKSCPRQEDLRSQT